jgi:bifunctional enzyme CysN/CysC
VVLAINKFDLVGYSQSVFNEIVATYSSFSAELGFSNIVPIPVSARHGDNVSELSLKTEWYSGPTLLGHLETAELQIEAERQPFRMPVQWVNRPDLNLRGYCGTIAAGQVKVGDEIIVVPSRLSTVVSRIITPQGEADVAARGEAVTVILERDIDISRGDLLGSATHPPEVADQFAADLVALGESDLLPGRSYLMRIGTKWISASITAIKYRLDVNTGQHLAATALHLNEIGRCNIAITHPVGFDPYACNRTTGAFILVDRATNETIAAGMIMFGLRRSQNLVQTDLAVSQEQRAAVKQQRPVILWLTGLPGSGKSTIAKIIERRLYEAGRHTYMLDGDNIRHGLNRDLGFSEADRVENIRRAGEVAKLFLDAGLIVICSFISPFRAERDSIRSLVAPGEFVEIFVDTPLEECIRRDPKGLYGKAHAGLIKNFTGLDSPYEAPTGPELKLDTLGNDAETLAAKVVDYLAAGKL